MITSGLDVHKDSVFCATFDGKTYGEVTQYGTLTRDIKSMGEGLKRLGVQEIAMESTGIYWIPIWNILEVMGFKLLLVNPFLIKQMPGRKSDVKDAQWTARLLHRRMLRSSLVPDEKIRELRTYTRTYRHLVEQRSSVELRIERTLEMCSIRITSLASTVNAKSVFKVVEQIIVGVTDSEKLVQLIHRRIINKHLDKVQASLEGVISEQHRFTLELLIGQHQLLDQQIGLCEERMLGLCIENYAKQLGLLQTIPGINTIAAIFIIAETGADMHAFETSNKFSGWTGLRPRNDESAGKLKSTATTKGNKYLRTTLVQCAWAASRMKSGYFKEFFAKLAIRKSRKKALIAVARKLGVICWNVLYFGQPYNVNRVPTYDPQKVQAKIKYHQRELAKLAKM